MRQPGLKLALLLLAVGVLPAADAPWPTSGWTVATPESQGMDTVLLERADDWIRNNSPNRYSLLVVRNGYLVFERYYHGASPDNPRHVASISKSFLSALVGIAREQGTIRLSDRFFDTLPEYRRSLLDERTLDLRVWDMLTMTMGLRGIDDDILLWFLFPLAYPDWIGYTLEQPFISVPGAYFYYNTGTTHALSAFLTRKTGTSTRDYAEQKLFQPLGIRVGDWWRDPLGFYAGGFGMHMTPRDLAKFGYLYLHGGEWDGRQVVPREWVRDSTLPWVRTGPAPDEFYGYLWWMDDRRGFFVPHAAGLGGQHVWFSRDLNLVVVTTADTTGDTGGNWRIMHDYVVPSVFHGPPVVPAGAVVNAASGRTLIAPDSFASIYGENLAPAAMMWDSLILDGATLPAELGGVSVSVAGRGGWLSYAGPKQVNVLLPADVPAGNVEIEVRHPGGAIRTTVTVAPHAPGLFAAATFAGEGIYVGEPGSFPGVTSRPARAGDNLELYATGLGATREPHPAGRVFTRAYSHADPGSVRAFFGETEAVVQAVNMTYAGLWQVNVKVPQVASGNTTVTLRVAGEISNPITLRTSN